MEKTIREKMDFITERTNACLTQLLDLTESDLDKIYESVRKADFEMDFMKSHYGITIYNPYETNNGTLCGGCENALVECTGEDELPYITPEDLLDFIKSVYALIEEERGGDEVQ